jgi:hypothetical protein
MHVLFMAPHFPANQRQFVRALHSAGAAVTGLGDSPVEHLDSQLKSWMVGYEHVPNLADEGQVFEAVRRVQGRGWVDRLECTVEALMLQTARVREATKIPGLSVDQVTLCRDKFVMKQFLRERGIPCAANVAVNNLEDARRFVDSVGFPVIVKPRDGAGAAGTSRCDSWEAVARALGEGGLGTGRSFLTMEEFVTGHEGFYDTLTCNGEVVFEAVSHYYPNVLDGMRNRWISPYIITTNRIAAEGYSELRSMGRRVVRELGLETTPTHMEWFFGGKGLYFSEIGARPPGVRFWDLYCWANEIDLYGDWANALVHGRCAPKPSRRYSAGLISLRPNQDGNIAGYSGLEELKRDFGQWLGDFHLPAIGQPTADVGSGYMGHAWFHVRHPDYDECRRILDHVGRTVKVWAR